MQPEILMGLDSVNISFFGKAPKIMISTQNMGHLNYMFWDDPKRNVRIPSGLLW